MHFIPREMAIHLETMTLVMAEFSRWVGKETKENELMIMEESKREPEKLRMEENVEVY